MQEIVIDCEAIKQRTSMRDILSMYGVACEGTRAAYRVPCPIHNGIDKNMSVDDKRGLFYCFVCGAGGSVIDLVAALDGVTPQEAAAKLSYGLGDVEVSKNIATIRKAIRQVDRWKEFASAATTSVAVPFDLRSLPAGYRNLSSKAIAHYKLAVCDRGVYIPHFGIDGRSVGYSIRQPDGIKPKYLNNPGFPRHIPFGLYQNKDQIIKRGFAIVCEGQIDSINIWDLGFQNVVALMGSSLSEQQAYLLLSVTTKLLLMLDGDKAGRLGMVKINRRWDKCFTIENRWLPDGLDPGDLTKEMITQ